MHLTSPDGVHFCLLGERSIFLDVERDRYFAASPETTQALVRAINGTSLLGSDEARLQPLLNQGLLCLSQDPSRPLGETIAAKATRDLSKKGVPSLDLICLATMLQLRAQHQLRRGGLATIIAARMHTCPGTRSRAIEDVAAAHRAADLIISPHQRCLMKSVGLFDLLIRSGHRPTFIMGVRDYPFTAHAWVQLGDMVIGDKQERVAHYRPILAV
ncbi:MULTISPECIES: lasso peptide biosynthesis B2 protein [Sphingomonas]|jgi:hypothetical protein|uniref:Microcin J25-processing protein McjB C-terminal domain-containing protein n=1 Tax=Sphingomonas turrisvirgatae TaxID=1888892 RepID=A0A1E3LYH7_9SPHN|nr:lasso peptide biosynthesis B2 protein [Sphingomonas turrisvirgatae]ODP38808.1 hypothetical protein BFL28_13540 [Sphingomonas turrisvirgatae]